MFGGFQPSAPSEVVQNHVFTLISGEKDHVFLAQNRAFAHTLWGSKRGEKPQISEREVGRMGVVHTTIICHDH